VGADARERPRTTAGGSNFDTSVTRDVPLKRRDLVCEVLETGNRDGVPFTPPDGAGRRRELEGAEGGVHRARAGEVPAQRTFAGLWLALGAIVQLTSVEKTKKARVLQFYPVTSMVLWMGTILGRRGDGPRTDRSGTAGTRLR